jgi:hypothetical protein
VTAAALLLAFPVARPGLDPALRWAVLGAAAVLGGPWAVIAVAAAAAGMARRPRAETASGPLLLADQVALGLRAGLTLEGSLRAAAPDLPPALQAEVGGVLRRARSRGMAAALAASGGGGAPLYRITERAVRTGAPLAAAVEALAGELRHEDHSRRVADARRLPVRMLLPLALLILPGFVLALVGPALVGGLARLDIGW